jgi:hypothetical protein
MDANLVAVYFVLIRAARLIQWNGGFGDAKASPVTLHFGRLQ